MDRGPREQGGQSAAPTPIWQLSSLSQLEGPEPFYDGESTLFFRVSKAL